jgi:hypothetical protein
VPYRKPDISFPQHSRAASSAPLLQIGMREPVAALSTTGGRAAGDAGALTRRWGSDCAKFPGVFVTSKAGFAFDRPAPAKVRRGSWHSADR